MIICAETGLALNLSNNLLGILIVDHFKERTAFWHFASQDRSSNIAIVAAALGLVVTGNLVAKRLKFGVVFFVPVSQRLLGFFAVLFENLVAHDLLAIGECATLGDLLTDRVCEALCPLRTGGQSRDLPKAVVDLLVGQDIHSFSLPL